MNLPDSESPGSKVKNDIDPLYSQIFIYLLRQFSISIFRRQSSKLSKKSYVPAFYHIGLCNKKLKVIRWPFV